MTFKNAADLFTMFVALPVWIGILWTRFLKIKEKREVFFNAWILGFVTLLAVGQIILVPMVAAGQTLTNAVRVWKALLTVLAVLSLFAWLRGLPELKEETAEDEPAEKKEEKRRPGAMTVLFGCLAAVLIFGQAFILLKYQHIDDDDSRFVAEEVSAVVHDTMLVEDPITVDFMYWDLGEVRKDLTSPWTMYVSVYCRIMDMHPAIFSHTYFPFFMVLICYVLYGMIGRVLFSKDTEKVFLFLIFVSALHIFGYTSTHTLGSMLLLRIWQGKAVVASFIIPLLFYLMYRILQQKKASGWVAALYAVSFAGALLSGIGIVIVPVMVAIYGLVDFIYCRNWRKTLGVWLSAVPCGIYLGYYLLGLL